MTTALVLWRPSPIVTRPTALARRRRMHPISSFMGRRERLHFAFLHICKRIMIQQGQDPHEAERTTGGRQGGHVTWWHELGRRILERNPPPLHLAEDEDLMAVVVPLSRGVDMTSDRWDFYPDGWRELVAWAAAGCPSDERDRTAARVRVEAAARANDDRLAALPATGTDEAFGRDEVGGDDDLLF